MLSPRLQIKRPHAVRRASAILIALPLLPLAGYLLQGPPELVFYLGATAFIVAVQLLVWLLAWSRMPNAGSPAAGRRLHFTIRDLVCLTVFVFGMTVFMFSAFRCEAAERASRPGALPAATFRQFVWEQESGLFCVAVGCMIWIRSVLTDPKKSAA